MASPSCSAGKRAIGSTNSITARGAPVRRECRFCDDAVAWFVGRTLERIDLGDHVGYLLEPLTAWASESSEDLLCLSDVADIEPGHEA